MAARKLRFAAGDVRLDHRAAQGGHRAKAGTLAARWVAVRVLVT